MKFLVLALGLCQTLSEETKGRNGDRYKVELSRNEMEDDGHVWNKKVEEITKTRKNKSAHLHICTLAHIFTLSRFQTASRHPPGTHSCKGKHQQQF